MAVPTPTIDRLEDQIAWYDRRSRSNQAWFKRIAIVEVIVAASIPLAAGNHMPPLLTGSLGVLIVVLQGLQQLNQYQSQWISYRSTCEALKHEKFLFLGRAGPYASLENPEPILAERIETIVSREHAQWVRSLEKVQRHEGGTK